MSAVNILGVAGSLIVMDSLFEMLRRHRLREKYALIWFVMAAGGLVLFGMIGYRLPGQIRARRRELAAASGLVPERP